MRDPEQDKANAYVQQVLLIIGPIYMKITKQAILQNIKSQFIHQNDMHDRKSNQPESQ